MVTTRPVQNGRTDRWVARHRFIAFVALTYATSWSLWFGAAMGGGQVLFLLGALGPMAAAAVVTAVTGGSLIAWIRTRTLEAASYAPADTSAPIKP